MKKLIFAVFCACTVINHASSMDKTQQIMSTNYTPLEKDTPVIVLDANILAAARDHRQARLLIARQTATNFATILGGVETLIKEMRAENQRHEVAE
ncbi:MAG: hypothetical protein AB7F19_02725 [Candidatus Babeliales bacterium]